MQHQAMSKLSFNVNMLPDNTPKSSTSASKEFAAIAKNSGLVGAQWRSTFLLVRFDAGLEHLAERGDRVVLRDGSGLPDTLSENRSAAAWLLSKLRS